MLNKIKQKKKKIYIYKAYKTKYLYTECIKKIDIIIIMINTEGMRGNITDKLKIHFV